MGAAAGKQAEKPPKFKNGWDQSAAGAAAQAKAEHKVMRLR